MTEDKWLACADPETLLWFLLRREDLTERKQRLFAAACCRRIWHLLRDERSRAAVEVAERWADGNASPEDLLAAFCLANDATAELRSEGGAASYAASAAEDLVDGERLGLWDSWLEASLAGEPGQPEGPAQAALVRDIFGNPFRPATIVTGWLSPTVASLARGIYEDRTFDRLPILADALEEAGCTSGELLDHCRCGGPHVRGCWAVDLILGWH